MDTTEFDKMFEVEETNWWYRGRRHLVTGWIERQHAQKGPLRMLDVACATGMSFRFLSRFGSVRGVDISEETIRLCRTRGIDRIVLGDAMRLPFADHSFDVVLALDALEHFEDDAAAIAEIRRVIRPDGLVLVTVPAFMFLWSPHDEAYHHVRRYTRPLLRSRLEAGGLQVDKVSYYSMSLLPPVYLMRKGRALLSRGKPAHSDFFLSLPGLVEAGLYGLMRTELLLMKAVDLPFGVSLFAAARPGAGANGAPAS